MTEYKMYAFEVELIYESTGETMVVWCDYECENPDDIVNNGIWPDGFASTILDNISIVPISYVDDDED